MSTAYLTILTQLTFSSFSCFQFIGFCNESHLLLLALSKNHVQVHAEVIVFRCWDDLRWFHKYWWSFSDKRTDPIGFRISFSPIFRSLNREMHKLFKLWNECTVSNRSLWLIALCVLCIIYCRSRRKHTVWQYVSKLIRLILHWNSCFQLSLI